MAKISRGDPRRDRRRAAHRRHRRHGDEDARDRPLDGRRPWHARTLELAARGAARPELDKFNEHATYTFAAPRGNCPFAELFERTFPSASAHWALQNASDAIPHLPFAAWGFRHPGQIAKLPNSEGAPIRVTSEEGDPVHMIRPREGKLINWAVCHELDTYASQLRALAGFGPADDGCADGYDWASLPRESPRAPRCTFVPSEMISPSFLGPVGPRFVLSGSPPLALCELERNSCAVMCRATSSNPACGQ